MQCIDIHSVTNRLQFDLPLAEAEYVVGCKHKMQFIDQELKDLHCPRLSTEHHSFSVVVRHQNFTGASWQMLKTEIGGDGQSSYGSETAVMHTPYDVDYRRGYETWLLREAKNRSASIPTYCLSWTTPYWVGNGTYVLAHVCSINTVLSYS